MSTITFDTLKFVERLEKAGVTREQASAMAEAFKDASGEAEIATRKEVALAVAEIKTEIVIAPARCAMISAREIVMSSITFDTHEFVKRLRDSGFTETQAEALSIAQKESLSQALDGQLATKTDITDLRRDMAEMKYDLLKWVVGIALAQIGLLVGILVKLLQ